MAMDMSERCGSPTDFEPFSRLYNFPSPQLDYSIFTPSDSNKDHHVPAIYNTTFPENMPSLGLTGDTNLDEFLTTDDLDQITPRKRDRGERIVWTPEEDELLRRAVQKYGDKTEKWAKIAACVPGRTNKNCRKRWFHSLDPSLKKGAWTEEEDHLLKTGVQKFKGQWSKIAERIQGRTDDQCAKRWRESLDPHIDRAAWTAEDDLVLLQKFGEYGSQWQKIALSFPGRPGLHCRNRWRKIQRNLNHLQRASKRKKGSAKEIFTSSPPTDAGSNIDSAKFDAAETKRLMALLVSHNASKKPGASGSNSLIQADDAQLLQDVLLNEDFNAMDDPYYASLTDLEKDDKEDASDGSSSDEDRPYGCAVPDCFFESSSPSLLFYHLKATHPGTTVDKPFRCTMPGCETRKRYKNINGLQYHVAHAKNSSGHSGHGASHLDGVEPIRLSRGAFSTSKGSPNTPLLSREPQTPADILKSAHLSIPRTSTASAVPSSSTTSLSRLHTDPAMVHTQPHSIITRPSASHQAFNILHTTDAMEESPSPSQQSLPSIPSSPTNPAPSLDSRLYQCPEFGCNQKFHAMGALNSHMANNHGHKSMTMSSNDSLEDSEARVMLRNGFDQDDLAFISESGPTLGSSLMMLDDSQMHARIDNLARRQRNLSLDSNGSSRSSRGIGANSMHGILFGDQDNNRIHFGTHINVGVNEPLAQLSVLTETPVHIDPSNTSINTASTLDPLDTISTLSSAMSANTTSEPPSKKTKTSPTKKFPCGVFACVKSYSSQGALKTHLRNDHSEMPSGRIPLADSTRHVAPMEMMAAMAATGSSSPASPAKESTILLGDTKGKGFSGVHVGKKAIDDSKPYKCLVPNCGRSYTNINGLKTHLLQAHGSTPKSA